MNSIQKEREAFQKFCEESFDFERHEQTYFNEQTQCYENDIGEDTESINMAWSAWQAAKAQAVPELTDKMIVAIESEVESQLKASAIDADPFRLDGEKIWYAALEAQEST
ncbi:hypothetical protein ACDI99_10280 [Acinetobacter radioresistens]|uniref:hypothetical protein n=1 Tax=Acinetobacter radioresistens TaxID=40216 RepID=UPI0021CD41B3|nr:hypothetical protein [Acinetobacter radioresistens]MCU4595315.1 hypothetical protein [Acinetobacter radioresistens]